MRDFIPRKIDINGDIDAVNVKQFDNDSRYIHVTISDEDLSDGTFDLLGCSAALYIQPLNNDDPTNVSFVAGEIADAENGIVTFLLPGGVTQNAGQYECEIWIYEGDSQSRPVISTKPFLLIVEKSIRNTSAVEASQSFSELDRALIEVQSVRNEVNALAALADNGEIPAGTLESEVVDARSGFSTLGAALRACVKGMNVYLNADRFRTLFGDSNYENGNFDNVGNNKIYPIGLSNGGELGNSPGVNINGTMVTFGRGDSRGNGDMQMIFTVAGSVWYRTCWNGWNEWKRQTRFDEFSGLAARVDSIEKPWQGLKVSVLGDSISTYPNHIPSGNACYYNTGNHPSVSSVNSMWWKQLCDITGATPLVIEAWSGSCCAEYNSAANSGNSAATAAVDNSRCKNLHTGSGSGVVNPDIIIVALSIPTLSSWHSAATTISTTYPSARGTVTPLSIPQIQKRGAAHMQICSSRFTNNILTRLCYAFRRGSACAAGTVTIFRPQPSILTATAAPIRITRTQCAKSVSLWARQNYGLYFADDINAQTNAVTHPNATGQEVLGQSIAAEVIGKAKGYVNWLRR